MEDKMALTEEYFERGHTCNVILDELSAHHDINKSLRILKAWLKELGLRRWDNYSSTNKDNNIRAVRTWTNV